jgi:RNA recognition motif-containing protein
MPAGDRPPEGHIIMTPLRPSNYYPFSVCIIMASTNRKIYVAHLSKSLKEDLLTAELTAIYKQFGELVRVDLVVDRKKKHRGNAFLEYKNRHGAITATSKENCIQDVRVFCESTRQCLAHCTLYSVYFSDRRCTLF